MKCAELKKHSILSFYFALFSFAFPLFQFCVFVSPGDFEELSENEFKSKTLMKIYGSTCQNDSIFNFLAVNCERDNNLTPKCEDFPCTVESVA